MNEESAHPYVQIQLAVSLASYKNTIHIFLVTYNCSFYFLFFLGLRQLNMRAEDVLHPLNR